MKKNKIFAIIAAALVMTACSDDFLEVQKPDGEPLEEYYTTTDRIFESVTSAYAPLHWPDWDNKGYNALNICGEIMGDDFWVGGSSNTDNQHWHMLSNFEATANYTLGTLWTDFYSGVKRCNDAIKYVGWGRENGLDKATLDAYEIEARVLRVYYYNTMWKYYGNIPFYLENLEYPYTAPQMKADEIYENLIVDLEDAISTNALPMRWDDENAGRISNATAMMLYAEMAMYQNDEARMKKAADYMQQIINSGKYELNPDFANIWETSGEWCNESIFEITYDCNNVQRDWGNAAMNAGGTVLPTLISPNSWCGELGWSGEEGWGFLPVRTATYDMYADEDVRRDATVWDVRGYSYTERFQDTHLWLGKYRPQNDNLNSGSHNLNYNNNLRVYRYAETLLNAAELAVRGYGSANAQSYLDMVRTRAGLGSIPATLDNIIEERHLEFVGEGKRYFDLVRMVDVPASSVNALNALVECNCDGTNPNDAGRTGHWTKDKKHIPLAQGELDADPTLVQNDYK